MKKAKKYSTLRTNLQLLAHQDYLTFANNEDDKILFKSAQNYDLSLPAKEEMLSMDKILSQLKNETVSQPKKVAATHVFAIQERNIKNIVENKIIKLALICELFLIKNTTNQHYHLHQ